VATRGIQINWRHSNDSSPSLEVVRSVASALSANTTTSITLPSYNEWHHIVVVNTGERQLVYIDGTLKDYDELTSLSKLLGNDNDFLIGRDGDTDLDHLGGNVSYGEHAVVPYALTAQEVGDLNAAGRGYYPAGNSYAGLVRKVLVGVVYYRMTERSGDTATDDMTNLDGTYTGDLRLADTVSALRGGFQPGVRYYSSTDVPGHLLVADSSRQDFFDDVGDFSVVLFFRRDREFRFGPMPMFEDAISSSATTTHVFTMPDATDGQAIPKAKPGDLWLITAGQTNISEDAGADLVTAGFTSLWNAVQTNYRTFGVYKFVTQADIDAHSVTVTTTGSETIYGTAHLIRSARAIEAVHNNAGSNPSSIDPTWAEAEYLWRSNGGFGWNAGVVNFYDNGQDVRTTSETFDPSDIDMTGTTEQTSWTIAVRGFSDGAGDIGGSSYLFFRHDGTDGHHILYDPDNDQIVYSRDAGATVHTVTISQPAIEEWHMLVATYDGADMSLYLDGDLATAKTGSNPQASTLNVGTLAVDTYLYNTTTTPGLEFLASDAALFDRALTATEISQGWEAARGGISARGSLMMRWTTGSRNGWVLPFDLGVFDFGYVMPFDILGTQNAKTMVLPFILNGPGAAGPNGYRDLAYAMAPVGYWTLTDEESTFLDSIGAVHGTATGTFQRNVYPALVNSPNNKMVEFDNSAGAYIDLGDNFDRTATGAFSWAGFIRDDGQDGTASIVTKWDGTDGYYINITATDIVNFGREGTGVLTEISSTTALSGIHHIAATYDGTNMRLYIDGTQEDTDTSTDSVADIATALTLGGAAGESLNAAMDEWGVWDRALSPDEVWTLSQARESAEKQDSGYVLPFLLDGPVESEYVLPFSIIDATTGVDDSGYILAPLLGWYDPVTQKPLSYIEATRSTSGCCGLYLFDEASGATAYDHLGGIEFDYIGSPTLGTAGPLRDSFGTAVTLDGASQSIRYPTSTAGDYLHVGDTLSMVIWFRRDGLGSEELYCAGTGGLEVGFDGSDQLFAAKEGTGDFFTTTTTVTDTAWHMVAVTKAGSTRAMYLDGQALTNSAGDQTLTDTTGDIYIGRHQPSATDYFDGTLGALAIFDAAISAAVVADLYARARG
jgi:hypothetical protein